MYDVEKDTFSVALLNDDGTQTMPGCGERVSKKDLILFRFVKDVQEPRLPSLVCYSIMNGILVKDGVPVTEQGEFVFARILGTIKNCLLLMTEDWNIVLYNLRKDVFKTLVFTPASKSDDIDFKYKVTQPHSPFLAYCNIWKTGDAGGEKTYKESVVLAENKNGAIVTKVLTDGEIREAFTTNGNKILVISYITCDGAEASAVH